MGTLCSHASGCGPCLQIQSFYGTCLEAASADAWQTADQPTPQRLTLGKPKLCDQDLTGLHHSLSEVVACELLHNLHSVLQ